MSVLRQQSCVLHVCKHTFSYFFRFPGGYGQKSYQNVDGIDSFHVSKDGKQRSKAFPFCLCLSNYFDLLFQHFRRWGSNIRIVDLKFRFYVKVPPQNRLQRFGNLTTPLDGPWNLTKPTTCDNVAFHMLGVYKALLPHHRQSMQAQLTHVCYPTRIMID